LTSTSKCNTEKTELSDKYYATFLPLVSDDRYYYLNAPIFNTSISNSRLKLFTEANLLPIDLIGDDSSPIESNQKKRHRLNNLQLLLRATVEETESERIKREYVENMEVSRRFSK
jgi:hypothetical protein